jgi:lysophospholipase L1-like esterase
LSAKGSQKAGRTRGWKKLLFSLVPAAALFAALEGGLAWLDWPPDPLEREAGRPLAAQPAAQAEPDDNVLLHLRDNVLTAPDPELLFRVRPNPGGGLVHGYSGINAQGFRGRPLEAPPPGASVVLLLGDSCAFGWRIRDVEKTLASRLERELAARGAPVEVYNLSQPGYSSTQTRMLYERWAPVLGPQVVILYQGWNDLWESAGGSDREQLERLARWGGGPAGWIRRSRTFQLADAGLRPLRSALASGQAASAETRRVPMEEAIANHRAVVEDARRRGAVVLWVPPSYSARGDPSLHPIADYNRALEAALAGQVERIAVPEMEPGDPRSPDYFVDDAFHPNARGAERLARALAERLAPPAGS